MEFKRQKVEPEVSSSHTPSAYHHQDPLLSALYNPVIMDSVFRNLDLKSLKKCREVCSKWSAISKSKPFLHPDCVIRIGDACEKIQGYNVRQLSDLKGANLPCGVKYEICKTESNLPQILDKIKGTVKSLELNMKYEADFQLLGNPKSQKLFTQIELPYLKSLKLIKFVPSNTDSVIAAKVNKEYAHALLEIIKRSPNLQELHMQQDLPIILWDALLGPEGLARNERFKNSLDTLTFTFYNSFLSRDHMEAFRKMNLKLKTFKLEEAREEDNMTDANEEFAALSIWIKDLSSSLETCSFTNDMGDMVAIETFKFLTEMKVLTNLEIQRLAMLDEKDSFIRLLKQLPKLEKLSLINASLEGFVAVAADVVDELSFPNLKELTFRMDDCEYPSYYSPKLFPSLKKLSMAVESKNTFFSCIYDHEKMMIEELELYLLELEEPEWQTDGITSASRDGWNKVPSFASWKRLRKLILHYRSYGFRGHYCRVLPDMDSLMVHAQVYRIPVEKILPGSLRSLTLSNLNKMDAKFLLKLVKRLPLLTHLDLPDGSVVDQSGNLMKRSVLMDKINNKSLNSPNLSIFNLKFAPEDDFKSTSDEDQYCETDEEDTDTDQD